MRFKNLICCVMSFMGPVSSPYTPKTSKSTKLKANLKFPVPNVNSLLNVKYFYLFNRKSHPKNNSHAWFLFLIRSNSILPIISINFPRHLFCVWEHKKSFLYLIKRKSIVIYSNGKMHNGKKCQSDYCGFFLL